MRSIAGGGEGRSPYVPTDPWYLPKTNEGLRVARRPAFLRPQYSAWAEAGGGGGTGACERGKYPPTHYYGPSPRTRPTCAIEIAFCTAPETNKNPVLQLAAACFGVPYPEARIGMNPSSGAEFELSPRRAFPSSKIPSSGAMRQPGKSFSHLTSG